MKVQRTNSTDNYQNPKFKATFVNNNNFRYFWINSKRSPKFNQVVYEFLKIENGKLEIRNLRRYNTNDMNIYNHNNGMWGRLSLPLNDYNLEQLMNAIMKDCYNLFWAPEIKTDYSHEEAIQEVNKKLYLKFPYEKDHYEPIGSGVLCGLIHNSEKSPDYIKNVEEFINSTDANFVIYENDGIYDKYRLLVMNLKTGTHQELGLINTEYNLEDFLELIRTSNILMKPSCETEIYKKLTGQE